MCGISGVLSHGAPPAAAAITAMTDTIVHRGPDDAGVHVTGPVGLGMRRLSIVDLAGGHQPIFNETGEIAIVFNGEIYNFPALRRRLVAAGHTFRTHADTEVIVHLYEDLGVDCLRELDGMFAFALWDGRRQELLLARDRLGEKPLLYTHDARGLVFGSELRAVLAAPWPVATTIALGAFSHYLTFMSVPEPDTMLEAVHKLPAGHYLRCPAGGTPEVRRYWELEQWEQAAGRTEASYLEELGALLDQAVAERMLADVPVGAFLSGGVDSSVVTALMARHATEPVQTFAVRFTGDRYFDETPHARRVAAQHRTRHREITITPDAGLDLLAVAGRMSEPQAVPANLALYQMAKAAREHVKVVLTGDGGDEVFAGYHRYWWEPRMARLAALPGWGLVRAAERLLPGGLARSTRWRRFFKLARVLPLPADERYLYSFLAPFTEPEKLAVVSRRVRDAVLGLPAPVEVLRSRYAAMPGLSGLERRQYADLKHSLPSEMLTKTDGMTMAASLEARPPLLDFQLVEFAARLPAGLKVRGGVGKYLLKRFAEGCMPADLVHREKHGFEVPVDAWFRGALREPARQLLTGDAARRRGLTDPEAVGALLDRHAAGRGRHGQQLYALLVFELWCQGTLDGRGAAHG